MKLAVRFLDNVIDVSNYPLEPQRQEAKAKRRIGLGVTGLADALIFCGIALRLARGSGTRGELDGSDPERGLSGERRARGREGRLPAVRSRSASSRAPTSQRLDEPVREADRAAMASATACLTSIAPTGTISLLAGNVSSGIEPVFDFVLRAPRAGPQTARRTSEAVEDYAHALFRRQFGAGSAPARQLRQGRRSFRPRASRDAGGPAARTSTAPSPRPSTARRTSRFEAFKDVYLEAYALGLKGCTTYRPNPVTGSVLSSAWPSRSRRRPPRQPQGRDRSPSPRRRLAGERRGGVVYMAPPLEREARARRASPTSSSGRAATTPSTSPSTISSATGRPLRPFEIFINTQATSSTTPGRWR